MWIFLFEMTRIGGSRTDSNGSGSADTDSASDTQGTSVQQESSNSGRSSRFSAIWSLVGLPFVSRSSTRSHSRSPRRYRHHHHHGRRRRMRMKHRERNFLAAVCSMVVIVTLSTAMAAPNWFFLKGGGCRDKMDNDVHTLSVYQFFYMGHFTEEVADGGKGDVTKTEYRFSPNAADGKNNLDELSVTWANIWTTVHVLPELLFVAFSFSGLCVT